MTLLLLLSISTLSCASAQVSGDVTTYLSPNGFTEKCVILDSVHGRNYSRHDRETEQKYCRMNIYSNTAVCPKKTARLEKIRHYNWKIYQRLMQLDKDFSVIAEDKGELYHHLDTTFGLSARQKKMKHCNLLIY